MVDDFTLINFLFKVALNIYWSKHIISRRYKISRSFILPLDREYIFCNQQSKISSDSGR